MLGYFKKYSIIHFSHKATSSEEIEKSNRFILDGISIDMAILVQTGKYGDINTTDITTMGYYVIKFLP